MLRRLCITKLAHGDLALSEVMAAARHSSVAASVDYQQRQPLQAKKLNLLGMSIPDSITK